MQRRASCALLLISIVVSIATSISAQQIYWKKDHIYNGPGGKEIAVVMPTPTDTAAPTAAASLSSSSVTATSVTLNWSASTDSGGSNLAGYKIYRQQGSGANLPVGTVSGTTFTDQALAPSTSYNFTIVAFDNAQNHSTASNSVTITTSAAPADTVAPSVPGGLAGVALSASSVSLSWNVSIDTGGSGLANYRVYRNGTLVSSPTATAFTDSGLAANTAYSYTVAAVDHAGNASGQSLAVSVTTLRVLIFTDNFNRPDTPYLGYPNWRGLGYWGISSQQASMTWDQSMPAAQWFDELSNTTMNNFRATVSVNGSGTGIPAKLVGIVFWASIYSGHPSYRVFPWAARVNEFETPRSLI